MKCPKQGCRGDMQKAWVDMPGGITREEFQKLHYHWECSVCGLQRTQAEMEREAGR